MKVELIYALPDEQKLFVLELPEGACVVDAIEMSGIVKTYPELDITDRNVGIWYKQVKLTTPLRDKDRIEIYRPLLIDPKDARKNRVRKPSAKKAT